MKKLTFKGGIHPKYCKDLSLTEPLKEAPLPNVAVVPLSQNIGTPNTAVVNKGDEVEEGQVLGRSDSFVSSCVHSPVSGKVLEIKTAFHPTLGMTPSVFVERDKNKPSKKYSFTARNIEEISCRELISEIKNAGIVGMGGAAFPTHVKLSVPDGKKIKTLIINGAECEPYLTCDNILMRQKTKEIWEGIKILDRILHPKKIYIAIEDNKKDAYLAFQKILKSTSGEIITRTKTVLLKTKYPQGAEKQLIKAISGKEVPPAALPIDIGFLVQNIGTAYAVYEAVYYDKPLIERVVTLSGDCLNEPGNYILRVGITVKEIIEEGIISLKGEPKKIIAGGPMMGTAQIGTEFPILKNTSGVLFLSDKSVRMYEEDVCIKCAKCVDVCPVNLTPTEIAKNVKKAYWDKVEEQYVSDCMECGACAYICPARIPLVQYVKEGKLAVSKRKKI